MSKNLRVLIVDDEAPIRQVLRMTLATMHYSIEEAKDGQSGIQQAAQFHPNLILLDLGLPDMNGREVLKEIRKWSRVPIIILTVADDEQTKVSLLDAGADDYLTKPFGANELLARVRVALRNVGVIEATPIFISDDLKVDVSQKKVWLLSNEVKLTMTEFELLARLVRDRGKVVTQAQILKEIWASTAEDETHYVRIYINQLRKKIEAHPAEPKHILTEPGVGYRIV